MDRYEEMLSRYKTDLDDAQVAAAVEKIVRDNLATNSTPDVYKFLFSCIDLTSLHTEDNTDSITKFTKRVNDFEEEPRFVCILILRVRFAPISMCLL